MSDVLIALTFWLAGAMFWASVTNVKEKNVQMVALAAVVTLVGAMAFVFVVGVTVEVLQETNVGALIDRVAGQISAGDRRPKEIEAVPTPAPTPVPSDASVPPDDQPGFIEWLLFTPDPVVEG
ncbi:MAG: hypothetical protein GWN58_04115 [Anaerolineae bacterium]|nr:hypothetical protein [Anaerolineae bacterium]